jgi:hypothetical protein
MQQSSLPTTYGGPDNSSSSLPACPPCKDRIYDGRQGPDTDYNAQTFLHCSSFCRRGRRGRLTNTKTKTKPRLPLPREYQDGQPDDKIANTERVDETVS